MTQQDSLPKKKYDAFAIFMVSLIVVVMSAIPALLLVEWLDVPAINRVLGLRPVWKTCHLDTTELRKEVGLLTDNLRPEGVLAEFCNENVGMVLGVNNSKELLIHIRGGDIRISHASPDFLIARIKRFIYRDAPDYPASKERYFKELKIY